MKGETAVLLLLAAGAGVLLYQRAQRPAPSAPSGALVGDVSAGTPVTKVDGKPSSRDRRIQTAGTALTATGSIIEAIGGAFSSQSAGG